MRKILPLFLFVLFASTFAFSQEKTNQAISSQIKSLNAEKYLQLDYVKSVGVTKVLGFGEDFARDQVKNNNLSELSFGITFNYAGEKLTAVPDTFIMTFWAKAGKPKFAQSHALKVIVNGSETLDLGEARYATKSSEKGMEFLNFVVSRENLKKIANSSDARLMLGDAEFKFTPGHLRLFKNILEISNLP